MLATGVRKIAVVLLGLVVIAVGGFLYWKHHTKAKPVTVHQAVQQFRSSPQPTSTAATSSGRVTLAAPGVYGYATTGGETTTIPGTDRTYPTTTPITIRSQGCGETSTWQPLDQHSETQLLCLDGGSVRLASYTSTIKFFGVGSTLVYACPPSSFVYAPKLGKGKALTFTCSSKDGSIAQQVTSLGRTTSTVAGRPVRTLHLHVDTTLSGKNSGTSTQDYWLATSNSLVVRKVGDVDATQSGVHYTSHVVLQLKSLTPQR